MRITWRGSRNFLKYTEDTKQAYYGQLDTYSSVRDTEKTVRYKEKR